MLATADVCKARWHSWDMKATWVAVVEAAVKRDKAQAQMAKGERSHSKMDHSFSLSLVSGLRKGSLLL